MAALAAFAAGRGLADAAAVTPRRRRAAAARVRGALPLAFVATASGLGTLALEVLFTRLLVNAIDSSVFSFALVLATFLVSLALGSALVSACVDRLRSPWTLVAAGSWLGAVAILLAPALCTRVWLMTRRGALAARTARRCDGAAARRLRGDGPGGALVGTVLPAIVARRDRAASQTTARWSGASPA